MTGEMFELVISVLGKGLVKFPLQGARGQSSLFISTGRCIFTLYSFSMLKSSLNNGTCIIAFVIIVVVIIIPALHGGGASV